DTMTLRDLYKKSHWQASGPTFYQLHLLFDKHFGEQAELVDTIAERIQILGGLAIRWLMMSLRPPASSGLQRAGKKLPCKSRDCLTLTRSSSANAASWRKRRTR